MNSEAKENLKKAEEKRKVKIISYDGNLKMRNEIGEAEITLWPGEIAREGEITEVIAVFTTPKTETEDTVSESSDKEVAKVREEAYTQGLSAFQRYQQKGLSSNFGQQDGG